MFKVVDDNLGRYRREWLQRPRMEVVEEIFLWRYASWSITDGDISMADIPNAELNVAPC